MGRTTALPWGLGLQKDKPHGGCSVSAGAEVDVSPGGWERTQSESHKKLKQHLPKAAPRTEYLVLRERREREEERTTGRREDRTLQGGGGAEGV